MATPNKELSEKLASRQSRIEAGTTMSDPREGKSLLPPPRPAHERLVPAAVEAASLPSPRMCTEPWVAIAAPQLVSPRSTTLTIRVGSSEPAAAPSAAAAATATPAWVAAHPIMKVEWYQPGWLSALRAWNTAAVAAAEGSGEAVSATTAAAFGLPAASVVVLEGMGEKQFTVVGLAAESTYRMRVVPGRLLLTSIAKAAFEAGQGRLHASEELPKLAAGTEYAVVWSAAPSPESEPLTTLSAEAEKEVDKRAALARAAEEAAAAERQAKIAAAVSGWRSTSKPPVHQYNQLCCSSLLFPWYLQLLVSLPCASLCLLHRPWPAEGGVGHVLTRHLPGPGQPLPGHRRLSISISSCCHYLASTAPWPPQRWRRDVRSQHLSGCCSGGTCFARACRSGC